MPGRIALPPVGNPSARRVVEQPLLTSDECEAIVGLASARRRWEAAAVSKQDGSGPAVDAAVRSARLATLPVDESWPLDRLIDALAEINTSVFRMRLTGLFRSDAPAVARYRASEGGHFRPHIDAGATHSRRKLSYVVQLSRPDDYSGGDLLMPDLGVAAPRTQGLLVVFPSHVNHVVTPVIRGVRDVIVGWVHGPSLR